MVRSIQDAVVVSKAKKHTIRRKPKASPFGKAVRENGRTVEWLAKRSGYSKAHIWRVMRGEHKGSTRFHASMQTLMERSY